MLNWFDVVGLVLIFVYHRSILVLLAKLASFLGVSCGGYLLDRRPLKRGKILAIASGVMRYAGICASEPPGHVCLAGVIAEVLL